MKKITLIFALFIIASFCWADDVPAPFDYGRQKMPSVFDAESINVGKLVVDTIKGDVTTDGFIRNARMQSIDSIPIDSVEGYITFVFDDGSAAHYDSIFPAFTDSGAVGVLAIYTNYVKLGSATDWIRIKEMYDAGWEIASHTVTHSRFDLISGDSIRFELRRSQEIFAEQGIVTKSFVYPGGYTGGELGRRLTAQYYNCARGTFGTIETSPINTYSLPAFNCNHDTSTYRMKAKIDTAVTKKGWAIIMIHTIQSAEPKMSNDSILSLLSYAEQQGLKVVTLQQGLRYMGNVIEVGDDMFTVGVDGKLRKILGNPNVQIGNAGTTSHGLNADDDLFVTGKLEVKGYSYFDGWTFHYNALAMLKDKMLVFGDSHESGLTYDGTQTTSPTLLWYLSATPKSIIFCDEANKNKDFDHAAQTNPTIFIHSSCDPDNDNTQWVSICHDSVDAVINVGTGGIKLNSVSVAIDSVKENAATDTLFIFTGGRKYCMPLAP